jgi:hypothetical protein
MRADMKYHMDMNNKQVLNKLNKKVNIEKRFASVAMENCNNYEYS